MNGLTFKFGNSQEPSYENPWFLVIRTPSGTPNIVTGEPSTETRYEIFSLEGPTEIGEGPSYEWGSANREGTESILLGNGFSRDQLDQFLSELDSGKGEGVTWFE